VKSKRLRVGIDGRLVVRGLGIAQFILSLTDQIAEYVDVIWFGHPETAPDGVASVQSLRGLPYPALESPYGRFIAKSHHLDIFHFTGNTGWTTRGPVPFILTVHDAIFMDSRVRGRRPRQVAGHRYARWNLRRAIRHASVVTTVSHASANRLSRHFPDVSLAVIPNATDVPTRVSRQRHSFDFALVFGSHDPRKGLELAYRGWVEAGRTPEQLYVLCGRGLGENFRRVAALDVEAGRVKLVPYLTRAELLDLIRRAGVLLYPSLDEGFGFPVLEAMACGTPVITGLAPATLEVGGDAVARIDPISPVASIAGHLQKLDVDPRLRSELARAGMFRARNFSWSTSAKRYLAVYEAASGVRMPADLHPVEHEESTSTRLP